MLGCQVVWTCTHLPASYGDLAALSQDGGVGIFSCSSLSPAELQWRSGAKGVGEGTGKGLESLAGRLQLPSL